MNSINKHLGLVTKKFNEFFYVDVIDDKKRLTSNRFLCKTRKTIKYKNNFIFVGDRVFFSKTKNTEKNQGVIEQLIKRKNLLDRPSVANISDVYVTFAVKEPELDFSQLSKFLINAENLQVKISLILTKCDLISNKEQDLLLNKFEKWGYITHALNISESNGFNRLLQEFKTKECSILMGPSGVGKTTILNKIIPTLDNKTASVSKKIKRGKNTTRNVELFSLSTNSYIVDSPGFNQQELEIDYLMIQNLFPEIYNQLRDAEIKCKFRNCLHISEPGCILNKDFERYQFYRLLVEQTKNSFHQSQED